MTKNVPCDVEALFKRVLLDSRSRANGSYSLNAGKFFSIWFRDYGSPLFFVFKKNLHVTNMQFAELVALLQSMVLDEDQRVEMQFVSPKEFTSTLRNLWHSFPITTADEAQKNCSLLADLYSDLLRRIVVLSPHFGTCEVFLPPNLSLDLARLCGSSGYIHSCGCNVYVRNATKASYLSLRDSLKEFIAKVDNAAPIRLIVYSHEDTEKRDKEERRLGELTHGLEDCKVHLEKTYLGEDRLISAIRKLKEDPLLAKRIVIPEKLDEPTASEVDQSRSLFLVRDFSLGRHLTTKGEDVFLILYEQQYKNLNAFHYFDENKPAWITHTTTPHTLIGAMINVTRPGWPNDDLVICDPFVGTGTTLFELAKYEEARCVGRDISPLSEVVINDNKSIFSSTLADLVQLKSFVDSGLVHEEEFSFKLTTETEFLKAHVQMREAFFEFFTKDGVVTVDLDDEEMVNETALAKILQTYNNRQRLLFYLYLKTLRRNEGALHRGTLEREWPQRFKREMLQAVRSLEDLVRIYSKTHIKSIGNILIVQDDFSLSCTIDPSALRSDRLQIKGSRDSNVEYLEEGQYDVVIADPPYGFNTERRVEGLARLYKSMIPRMVRALRDGGQLVITLPERSYIGRRSPFFTHKEMVTQQVLDAAQETDFEVVKASVPEPVALFKPPYYWRSERALARSVLHFRFRQVPRSVAKK